jgi:hypothetical protein
MQLISHRYEVFSTFAMPDFWGAKSKSPAAKEAPGAIRHTAFCTVFVIC